MKVTCFRVVNSFGQNLKKFRLFLKYPYMKNYNMYTSRSRTLKNPGRKFSPPSSWTNCARLISFCITFFQHLSRVMRHKKTKNFKKKRKKIQNYEGSCNLGKTFWNPKKLLISTMEKKYQLCALLESGIGGLSIDFENLRGVFIKQ